MVCGTSQLPSSTRSAAAFRDTLHFDCTASYCCRRLLSRADSLLADLRPSCARSLPGLVASFPAVALLPGLPPLLASSMCMEESTLAACLPSTSRAAKMFPRDRRCRVSSSKSSPQFSEVPASRVCTYAKIWPLLSSVSACTPPGGDAGWSWDICLGGLCGFPASKVPAHRLVRTRPRVRGGGRLGGSAGGFTGICRGLGVSEALAPRVCSSSGAPPGMTPPGGDAGGCSSSCEEVPAPRVCPTRGDTAPGTTSPGGDARRWPSGEDWDALGGNAHVPPGRAALLPLQGGMLNPHHQLHLRPEDR